MPTRSSLKEHPGTDQGFRGGGILVQIGSLGLENGKGVGGARARDRCSYLKDEREL